MTRFVRPTSQAIILAKPDLPTARRIMTGLWGMLAVAVIGGTAILLLPRTSMSMSIAKGVAAFCALGLALYCLRVLVDLRKGDVGLVWLDGGVLFCRTPHLEQLRLEQPLTAHIARRRSVHGAYDELVVRNARGESVTVTTFYSDRPAAAVREALIDPEDANAVPDRPWG